MNKLMPILLLLILRMAAAAQPFHLEVEVTLGEDQGQPLGTLFEARDAAGKLVAGAGFAETFSTYVRDNPRMLSFFVRAPGEPVSVTPLGKPFDTQRNGARLLVQGQRLLAHHYFLSQPPFYTLTGEAWAETTLPSIAAGEVFGGYQPVGNLPLVTGDKRLMLGGQVLLAAEEALQAYYVNGRLFVYRANPPRVNVLPWKPGDALPLSLEDTDAFAVDGAGFPFAWGLWRDTVWFVSNIGTIYTWHEGVFNIIRKSDGTSWQGYTTARVYDTLLIGQYPTGSLFTFDDQGLRPFTPALPVPENASGTARELQTLAFYCGDLYAGVWPWGEVWRLDLDSNTWHFVTRLFDAPAMSTEVTAPYEKEMAQGEVYNYWGQRVTSLTPFGGALYAATFSKQGKPYRKEEHGFLPEEVLAQYGAIHRIKAGHQVAAEIHWTPQTRFRFEFGNGHIALYQDGVRIAFAKVHAAEIAAIETIHFGDGLYGPSPGEVHGIE